MMPDVFLARADVAAVIFVVLLPCELPEQVEAVQLVEHFDGRAVADLARFGVRDLERVRGQPEAVYFLARDHHVPDCEALECWPECLGGRWCWLENLPRDICSHASSTSGPLPTYGEPVMMGVKLYLTVSYLTTGAAGAAYCQFASCIRGLQEILQYDENCVVTSKSDGRACLMQNANVNSVAEMESRRAWPIQTQCWAILRADCV